MSYKFTFDISNLPKEIFEETTRFCEKINNNQDISDTATNLVEKFKIDKLLKLSFDDSKILIEDIIDIQLKNNFLSDYFFKADKKALFLPHCCRKYMDSNCKAAFKTDTSSYECRHCSKDCMVSQATTYAKKEGYDVYILPGASCLSKIFKKKRYEGIVGVACTDEIKLGIEKLMELEIPVQAIPLLKNGCSGTKFNINTLEGILAK